MKITYTLNIDGVSGPRLDELHRTVIDALGKKMRVTDIVTVSYERDANDPRKFPWCVGQGCSGDHDSQDAHDYWERERSAPEVAEGILRDAIKQTHGGATTGSPSRTSGVQE